MIVIGFTADRFGNAALDAGIAEARLRDTDLLVINSTVGDSYVDAAFRDERKSATSALALPRAECHSNCRSPRGSSPPMHCSRRWSGPRPSCW